MIMDRLYGGVCYAGIDTDPELKYPKGAGRVAFSNQQSYIAAISARFVQLQHGDIDKRVGAPPPGEPAGLGTAAPPPAASTCSRSRHLWQLSPNGQPGAQSPVSSLTSPSLQSDLPSLQSDLPQSPVSTLTSHQSPL